MSQIPSVMDPTVSDIAQELDDVGEEFGCARDPAETNEEYGIRVVCYTRARNGRLVLGGGDSAEPGGMIL